MKKSYYTCFKFKGHAPKDLHCTHKFIGRVDDETIKKVVEAISSYLNSNEVKQFSPLFKEEAWFGPNRDIRVLKTALTPEFLMDLKALIDWVRPEDFEYSPHVTTFRAEVEELIESYCLVCNGEVLQEWPLKA